jgi:beta-N-acetylhexosaminidase
MPQTSTNATPRAAIVGISGPSLTSDEIVLFRKIPPAGIILFSRNIENPDQVRHLTSSIREVIGEKARILIDQEGGRVARLMPPHWKKFPPAANFEHKAIDAVSEISFDIGKTCVDLGIDVVCSPVLDLRFAGKHDIIGDRSFSSDPLEVARLGFWWCQGIINAGCTPVVKHIPGHGRASADSHNELPVVNANLAELSLDFYPFQAVSTINEAWAMTAHILYPDLDPDNCATLSNRIISDIIRDRIGFRGVLVSDDIGMKALTGDLGDLAVKAVQAGCDLALHCSGKIDETAKILTAVPNVGEWK